MTSALEYVRSLSSHQSVFAPLHCELCILIDITFCDYIHAAV